MLLTTLLHSSGGKSFVRHRKNDKVGSKWDLHCPKIIEHQGNNDVHERACEMNATGMK